jgi:3-deoxy-D-manno-octulosonic-acid transferase
MLAAFGSNRPIILAASTHAGEEALIARAVREASPEALFAVVPRHAERRADVRAELEKEGFEVILRSAFSTPRDPGKAVLVIDSTGELRDWTAHADVVVIGKSFLGIGGQNPCEAVIAGKPVVFGAHMENFEPLATRLTESGGCLRVADPGKLPAALRQALLHDAAMKDGVAAARETLARHEGACARTVSLLRA